MRAELKKTLKELILPSLFGIAFLIVYYWKGEKGIEIFDYILITAIYVILINIIDKKSEEEVTDYFCRICKDIKSYISITLIILYIVTIVAIFPIGGDLQKLGIALTTTVAIIIGLPTACQYHCPKQQSNKHTIINEDNQNTPIRGIREENQG